MKIVYITSQINEDGGVQRVLSVKTNYFIQKWGYHIDIITLNNGNTNLFFDFNKNIGLHDIQLTGNKFSKLFQYKKQVQKKIDQLKPDCIIVCDFGLKGFSIPLLLKTKTPIIFEAHGSKYNESQYYKINFFSKITHNFKYYYRNFCAKQFDYFVALSQESLMEWSLKDGTVIPNPLFCEKDRIADVTSKTVIAVARQSYEKGLDRLLYVWKLVSEKHPDWKLEIYGSQNQDLGLEGLAKEYNIASSVHFFEPIKNIEEKYLSSSVYVMTSRSEGFPMVLLEAMSFGLPIIAYDCPIGPRSIIENGKNGFLIPEDDAITFAGKMSQLIEDVEVRKTMGAEGKLMVKKYDVDSVMLKWKSLFTSLPSK
jgi:glycosyltransferase involved in cell wall biosynthesis